MGRGGTTTGRGRSRAKDTTDSTSEKTSDTDQDATTKTTKSKRGPTTAVLDARVTEIDTELVAFATQLAELNTWARKHIAEFMEHLKKLQDNQTVAAAAAAAISDILKRLDQLEALQPLEDTVTQLQEQLRNLNGPDHMALKMVVGEVLEEHLPQLLAAMKAAETPTTTRAPHPSRSPHTPPPTGSPPARRRPRSPVPQLSNQRLSGMIISGVTWEATDLATHAQLAFNAATDRAGQPRVRVTAAQALNKHGAPSSSNTKRTIRVQLDNPEEVERAIRIRKLFSPNRLDVDLTAQERRKRRHLTLQGWVDFLHKQGWKPHWRNRTELWIIKPNEKPQFFRKPAGPAPGQLPPSLLQPAEWPPLQPQAQQRSPALSQLQQQLMQATQSSPRRQAAPTARLPQSSPSAHARNNTPPTVQELEAKLQAHLREVEMLKARLRLAKLPEQLRQAAQQEAIRNVQLAARNPARAPTAVPLAAPAPVAPAPAAPASVPEQPTTTTDAPMAQTTAVTMTTPTEQDAPVAPSPAAPAAAAPAATSAAALTTTTTPQPQPQQTTSMQQLSMITTLPSPPGVGRYRLTTPMAPADAADTPAAAQQTPTSAPLFQQQAPRVGAPVNDNAGGDAGCDANGAGPSTHA